MDQPTLKNLLAVCLGLAALLGSAGAQAAMYKCADAEGNISFSQTPCASGQSEKKMKLGGGSGRKAEACQYVRPITADVFRRMRQGMEADSQFSQYGGMNYISPRLLNIINYVYSFKADERARPARVAAMAVARCRNGSFGSVTLADIPEQYLEPEEEDAPAGTPSAQPMPPQGYTSAPPQPASESSPEQGVDRSRCEYYENQMRELNEKMRQGYSGSMGERYREQMRQYRNVYYSECR